MAVAQIIQRAIAVDSVGPDQLAPGAITAADIPNGEITADKLASTLDLSAKTLTITQDSVTAHQSALSLAESQVSGLNLDTILTRGNTSTQSLTVNQVIATGSGANNLSGTTTLGGDVTVNGTIAATGSITADNGSPLMTQTKTIALSIALG